jgi:hypothetical protein
MPTERRVGPFRPRGVPTGTACGQGIGRGRGGYGAWLRLTTTWLGGPR